METLRSARWSVVSLLAALLLYAAEARADFERGRIAWDAGRHIEAVKEWRAAARANDTRAMLALGRAFVRGLGVPQDFVEAHKWLNLAAGHGSAEAAAERDKLAKEMTAEERAEARKLARAWRMAGTRADTPPSAVPPKAVAPAASAGVPPARALKEAQTLLSALGYKPGAPDGKWGRRSIRAYRDFLREAGMPPSDVLSPAALRAMRRMARNRKPAARPEPRPAGGLHRAARTGDLNGLKAALKGKAEVNARDARGWTPLMHAVNKGYVLMVPPLLKAGAEVNLRAPDGATALFIAALHGNGEIATMLTDAGAEATVKGPQGRTPVDVALAKGFPLAFRDCPDCPEMVVVPTGSFMMGAPSGEGLRGLEAALPKHRVAIRRPFAIGKYEVTFEQWDTCVAAGGCGGHRPNDRGWGRGRLPVIDVSWNDAKSYVRWLSRKTGQRYRLPSEAEWEYAARAGTTGPYYFGASITSAQAKFEDSYGKTTSPVGKYPKNGFQLHDMNGNVAEWVEDCWHDNYAGAPSDGSAWTEGGNCAKRVLRGGAWDDGGSSLRSDARYSLAAKNRARTIGFRVARTPQR